MPDDQNHLIHVRSQCNPRVPLDDGALPYDTLIAYPLAAVEALYVAGPIVRGLILGNGIALDARDEDENNDYMAWLVSNDFEAWLVQRWLKHIRSETFRDSAEYAMLRGEWERQL